jgi:hypothetical protein
MNFKIERSGRWLRKPIRNAVGLSKPSITYDHTSLRSGADS